MCHIDIFFKVGKKLGYVLICVMFDYFVKIKILFDFFFPFEGQVMSMEHL